VYHEAVSIPELQSFGVQDDDVQTRSAAKVMMAAHVNLAPSPLLCGGQGEACAPGFPFAKHKYLSFYY
jgi:hypothetical protein